MTPSADPSTQRPPLFTAGELSSRLGAQLHGPGDVPIFGIEALGAAGPGDLSFIRASKHADALAHSKCAAALVTQGSIDPVAALAAAPSRPLIVVKSADEAMVGLLELLAPKPQFVPGRHPTAVIDPSANLHPATMVGAHAVIGPRTSVGEGTSIGPGVVVGSDVRIGRGCDLRSNCVIEDRTQMGDAVVIHAGAVIGSIGFGFRPAPGGRGALRIPHIGHVVLESAVEVGANSCIDRGKFGATRIGAMTKIDNQVQIGHNVIIGRGCIICGQCAIAGSVTIGDGVTLAGSVGIADGRTIGAGATLGARSSVMDDVPAGETWFGYPARPSRQAMRMFSALIELPDVLRSLRQLREFIMLPQEPRHPNR